ncbi:MAG: NAD(P)H-dependent oxidoreductase [Neptuniibacter sp.]
MAKALIINTHHYYEFSKGELNSEIVKIFKEKLENKGYETRLTETDQSWDIEEELEKHQWADVVIVQAPVNWMGVPWPMKKYMDEVYTAGMFGALCDRDGRSEVNPKQGYGTGGTLKGKKYMLSLTFNAPKEAFDNPNEYLFQGKSVDDLWFPMHMNFRFFAMEGLPTFACYDVMKNPEIDDDLKRLDKHIDDHF